MTFANLLLAAVLIVLNGFFVAAEFALVACRPSNLEALAKKGNRRARLALAATNDIPGQLAGAQLGITIASLALGFVGEAAVAHLIESPLDRLAEIVGLTMSSTVLHTISGSIALMIVVSLHMILGEMVPKNMALAGADRMMLALIAPFRAFNTVFRPVIWSLNAVAALVLRVLGIRQPDSLIGARTADEIATMLHASKADGLIEEFDYDLLSGALDFRDLEVDDVMVRREEVDFVSDVATVGEVEDTAVGSGHSRLVIVGDDLDDVLGFVHVKDVLQLSVENREIHLPTSRVRSIPTFSVHSALEPVFHQMRNRRVHFALVVDGRGQTAGLITLEDILEQLVGDIVDESDEQELTETEMTELAAQVTSAEVPPSEGPDGELTSVKGANPERPTPDRT